MMWDVSLAIRQGGSIAVKVFASDKQTAALRGARRAEADHNVITEHVIYCRKASR